MIDTPELQMLRRMITWPSKVAIRDIIARRIYCIVEELEYQNPFLDPVEETLFTLSLDIDRQHPKDYDEHRPERRSRTARAASLLQPSKTLC